ncbi:hypothetical protein QNI19_10370 [Cytophagaceae bacterium DM2B3-1]|uniref:Lipoprotein n=1 Tax=Xanthocytophaga flava TaxID=3048013 RepID=A0ABT7CHX8_9BACT|nr:hypothetical protein [Xanthocytophaga flavus]MDJ1493335.1 hypothetical protein [Xanthocytophaga flavus]
MKYFSIFILVIGLYGCYQYGVNAETSELGSISPRCLDSLAWNKMCAEHSIDSIKDEHLLQRVKSVKNHFIQPEYILYFKEEPEEIIGCDWYSVRVVYNAKLADQPLDGLDVLLGNDEQKRIRNRVFSEIMKYQCEEGKKETLKEMEEDVPYAESHKKYPLKLSPTEMLEREADFEMMERDTTPKVVE